MRASDQKNIAAGINQSDAVPDNKKQAYEPLRSMIKTAVSDISSTIRQFDNLVGNCIDGIMKQLKETSMA